MPASTIGPGAAFLPGPQALLVSAPAMAPRSHVLLRGLRSRSEELVIEVAPGELAHESPTASLCRRALGDLVRGEAAEVEVRRQARSGVCGQVVVALAVVREPASKPRGEAFATCGLPSFRQLRRARAADQPLQRRQATAVHIRRQREPPRRVLTDPLRRPHPCAIERREDAEMRPRNGRHLAERLDRDARKDPQLETLPGARTLEPQLATLCVAADIGAHEDHVGVRFDRDLHRLGDHVAAPQDESCAPRRE